jgi:predicted nucleic acid-binding protein
MIVVSNSTPLIVLSKTERLGLLKELFTSLLIPEAVRRELFEQGAKPIQRGVNRGRSSLNRIMQTEPIT